MEAKVQRKIIALAVAAGLVANKAQSGETDVSSVEAAAINAEVMDELKAHINKKKPSAVGAVQVVDPKAGVPTAETVVKLNYVGQNLNRILNKSKK